MGDGVGVTRASQNLSWVSDIQFDKQGKVYTQYPQYVKKGVGKKKHLNPKGAMAVCKVLFRAKRLCPNPRKDVEYQAKSVKKFYSDKFH